MKIALSTVLLLEALVFMIGFGLWVLDDPDISWAKHIGSSYGKSIMVGSVIAFFITICIC